MFGKKKNRQSSSRYADENRRYYRQESVPRRPEHAQYYNQRSYERQRGSSRYEAREMMFDDDARYDRVYSRPERRYTNDRYRDLRSGNGSRSGRRSGRGYEYAYAYPPRRKKRHTGLKVFLTMILVILLGIIGLGAWKLGMIDRTKLSQILTNAGLPGRSGYTNIVLYGVDSRTGQLTQECHSDTIMICSLNKSTKDVKIVSVYRDTYLDNTNGEYRKATECYFYGGPERSINMLNKNLDLNIKDYVTVNFNAVVGIIDMLGGIDLEITEEEMNYINGYCVENEQVTGVGYTPLTSAGYVHLDGTQALAYCRIRYTEGWDFKRTERQRLVLTLAWEKALSQGPAGVISIINAMLPQISTSMSSLELIRLAGSLGKYKIAAQTGFPFDMTAANIAAGDCVVPVSLANNVTQLHEFLFGDTGYIPSETVQGISAQISADTGI